MRGSASDELFSRRLHELEILLEHSDSLESWNATMLGRADPSLRRHLDPARTNILRHLSIDKSLRVLEIGAEAGVLTRYLGESARTVDALEPDEVFARLARLRTRDLNNVRVINGEIDTLPEESLYDVIVGIDGLRMASNASARAQLIRQMIGHLAPGGSLVLAESNRFGIKSLLGSPDDLTGRVFDAIEGYPFDVEFGALSRREIDSVLQAAGTHGTYLLALPDHTYTRAVVRAVGLPDELRTLSSDLSIVPSPDLNGIRPKLADERRVWPEAVAAGLEVELANSWLVVATLGIRSALLGDEILATFDGWQRAAKYTPHTVVRKERRGVVFDRVYPRRSDATPLYVEDSIESYVPGRTLLAVMEESTFDEILAWLSIWKAAVDEHSSERRWVDLHPGNFIVLPDGGIRAIDLEFASSDHDDDFGIRRGLVSVARDLAIRKPRDTWPERIERIEQLAILFGETLGYRQDSGWLQSTLRQEAEFQTEIAGERGLNVSTAKRLEDLQTQLATPLERLPLGPRVFDVVGELTQQLEVVRGENSDVRSGLRRANDELGRLRGELSVVQESRELLSSRVQALEEGLSEVVRNSGATEAGLRSGLLELKNANERLQHVLNSRTVRAALRIRGFAARMLPSGSRRRRIVLGLFSRSRLTDRGVQPPPPN